MRWAKRFLAWLFVKPWLAWALFVVGFLPAIIYTRQVGSLEDYFRYHGVALQLVGLGLVAKGLWDTTKRFKRTGLFAALTAWLKQVPVPFRKPRNILGSFSGGSGSSFATGEGRVWMPHDPAMAVEYRLKALEFNVDNLSTEMQAVRKIQRENFADLKSKLEAEAKERKAADLETASKLEKQVADGIVEGYFGLGVLLLGTLYSGIPKELSDCFVKLLPGP